jgi:Predicted nucleotidyltransferases
MEDSFMTTEMIRNGVLTIVNEYPIKKIILFGSRAEEINNEDSDVDLIMEFSIPVSLLTLSMIKLKLEEILHVGVDVIHGPIKETDLIEIGKVVELYAA